jgi:hypothetical protein
MRWTPGHPAAGTVPTRYLSRPKEVLTIDHGWREVADAALAFVQRFTR